jgi:Na+/H+-translocating membrane pyrophosphatase
MPPRMLYTAMRATIVGLMLLNLLLSTAGAIGTHTTTQSDSRQIATAAPRDAGGREMGGAQGTSISLFVGVILGLALGLLGYWVIQRWWSRLRRQRDIDRLTAQFQALFRETKQGKDQSPC